MKFHKNGLSIMVAAALLILASSPAGAKQQAAHRKPAAQSDSAMAAQAKVSMATAAATALSRVPGGKIKSSDLEREHGKLIYSFDIAVPGKPGIQEVNVNALTGAVISKHHEDAKAERQEARQDKAEAARDSLKALKASEKH